MARQQTAAEPKNNSALFAESCLLPYQRPQGAPDLAIEIASPSDKPDDLARKAQQYLAAGARAVWVLYPEARLAYLYRRGERIEVRDDSQSLDNPELLPGFGVPLSAIFGS